MVRYFASMLVALALLVAGQVVPADAQRGDYHRFQGFVKVDTLAWDNADVKRDTIVSSGRDSTEFIDIRGTTAVTAYYLPTDITAGGNVTAAVVPLVSPDCGTNIVATGNSTTVTTSKVVLPLFAGVSIDSSLIDLREQNRIRNGGCVGFDVNSGHNDSLAFKIVLLREYPPR